MVLMDDNNNNNSNNNNNNNAWGPEADNFVREVGRRLHSITGEARSTSFLRQKLSVAVQRGNAACILGTLPRDKVY